MSLDNSRALSFSQKANVFPYEYLKENCTPIVVEVKSIPEILAPPVALQPESERWRFETLVLQLLYLLLPVLGLGLSSDGPAPDGHSKHRK
jgi:hypothetical protein